MSFPKYFFKATDEYCTFEKHVNAPYIRKSFSIDSFTDAFITVSGLGFYDLYINGQKITKGLLAPYISNPDDIVYFDSYDVSKYLVKGENVIGLMLGNGFQNSLGGYTWKFDTARFRSSPKFALKFEATLENGEEYIFEADETFRTAPSPIFFDDIRAGNFYDATKELDGWNKPSFDDSEWDFVKKAEMPRGEFRLCEADPIIISKEVKPVSIKKAKLYINTKPNQAPETQIKFPEDEEGYLYDFGINTAGIIRLNINGKKGQQIRIQMCEFVNSKNEASYQNIFFCPNGYSQSDVYICKGEENEIYEPQFVYHGFRYAVVFGLSEEQATENLLTMLVAHSDISERGNFSCSDDTMNKLGEMARRSNLANFYYFPTDCPHREKNGWTGDAAISAEHMLLTLTPEKNYKEWLRNICKAQNDAGAFPGVVPTAGWGFKWGNGPAWDNVMTELCWLTYRIRGDLSLAVECKDSIFRYVSYIAQKRDENGIVAIGLGDWLQPSRFAGMPTSPLEITDSVISFYICRTAAKLFRAMNLPHHADFAEKIANELREAVRKNYIDFGTMTVRSYCQTSQAICMYYGIFNDCERQEAGKVLVRLIEKADDHLDTGIIGLRVIFHVLSDIGRGDLAFKMITRHDYPSYGFFIDQGLTSLPESFLPREKWDDPDSLNHHFFGDIISWFIQRVVGLRVNPREMSVNDFDIAPDYLKDLNHAEAFYDAPAGRISVKWIREGDDVILTVDCPDEITGQIILPNDYVFQGNIKKINGCSIAPLKKGEYRTGIR